MIEEGTTGVDEAAAEEGGDQEEEAGAARARKLEMIPPPKLALHLKTISWSALIKFTVSNAQVPRSVLITSLLGAEMLLFLPGSR